MTRGRPNHTPRQRSDAEANQLVEQNIPLIRWFARRWRRRVPWLDYADSISLCGEGLVVASRLWNPAVSTFSTFVGVCINNLMRTYLDKTRRRKLNFRECALTEKVLLWEAAQPIRQDDSAEQAALLDKVLHTASLTEFQRHIMEQTVAGVTAAELAARLDCTTSNIYLTVANARKKISKVFPATHAAGD